MTKKSGPLLAEGAEIREKLGMRELTITDQHGRAHHFMFLPKRFKEFAAFVSDAEASTPPADVIGMAILPRDRALAARAASVTAQSQAPGFGVFAAPTENIAFLHLREFNGQVAVMPFDASYLSTLIQHLSEALKAIQPAGLGKH